MTTDIAADAMHEAVVNEISDKLERDELVVETGYCEGSFDWETYDDGQGKQK